MNPITTAQHSGLRLVSVRPELWRVIARDERIIGHLERRDTAQGEIFIAKRFIRSAPNFGR